MIRFTGFILLFKLICNTNTNPTDLTVFSIVALEDSNFISSDDELLITNRLNSTKKRTISTFEPKSKKVKEYFDFRTRHLRPMSNDKQNLTFTTNDSSRYIVKSERKRPFISEYIDTNPSIVNKETSSMNNDIINVDSDETRCSNTISTRDQNEDIKLLNSLMSTYESSNASNLNSSRSDKTIKLTDQSLDVKTIPLITNVREIPNFVNNEFYQLLADVIKIIVYHNYIFLNMISRYKHHFRTITESFRSNKEKSTNSLKTVLDIALETQRSRNIEDLMREYHSIKSDTVKFNRLNITIKIMKKLKNSFKESDNKQLEKEIKEAEKELKQGRQNIVHKTYVNNLIFDNEALNKQIKRVLNDKLVLNYEKSMLNSIFQLVGLLSYHFDHHCKNILLKYFVPIPDNLNNGLYSSDISMEKDFLFYYIFDILVYCISNETEHAIYLQKDFNKIEFDLTENGLIVNLLVLIYTAIIKPEMAQYFSDAKFMKEWKMVVSEKLTVAYKEKNLVVEEYLQRLLSDINLERDNATTFCAFDISTILDCPVYELMKYLLNLIHII